MDSPHLQSYAQPLRVRTNSNLSVHSIDQRGGIRKRSLERSRSPSTTQVDRLHQLALGQTEDFTQSSPFAVSGTHWITPQHSPQLEAIYNAPSLEAFPAWSVPTPPRSDSGLPTVSIDAVDQPVTTCDSIHSSYHSSNFDFDLPTTSADMRSGYQCPVYPVDSADRLVVHLVYSFHHNTGPVSNPSRAVCCLCRLSWRSS